MKKTSSASSVASKNPDLTAESKISTPHSDLPTTTPSATKQGERVRTVARQLTPGGWWWVIVECKEQIILINRRGDGFWIHGQETEWMLDHVQEWICEIQKPEQAAQAITSALFDCSTLRHAMFTPPMFPSLCFPIILKSLTDCGKRTE
jgi:hypothetical protein